MLYSTSASTIALKHCQAT